MQTIQGENEVQATTTDVLGATPLRVMPGPGAVSIYGSSTVADSRASVTLGGKSLKTDSLVTKVSSDRQIDMEADIPLGIAMVRGGEVLTVDVTEVTAMTLRVLAVWVGVVR